MLGELVKRLFGRRRAIAYEDARELAANQDAAVRAQLASRAGLRPEILYYLAEDESAEVRRKVAANLDTPPQAHLILAADADDDVRATLAGKIARLAPGLSAHDQDRLRRATYDALELLARDRIPKVREILATALKDVAHAPPEVINRLARDAEIAVAAPVLQFSPVLSDDDLLEIIASAPVPGALSAISRRSVVGGRVADAIANTDDVEAIATLLANPSAQIREETLDRLIERAADIEDWHQPLCQRPQLSARTAAKLARFVAASLLQSLAARRDLDPATAQAVANVVARRLDEMEAGGGADGPAGGGADEDEVVVRVRQLAAGGKLTETAVSAALAGGDHVFVVCALAVLADAPVAVVRKVVTTQSAKGMVALTWKAGLSAGFGETLQARLLHLAPTKVLRAEDGHFPLGVAEMRWQLDFLTS